MQIDLTTPALLFPAISLLLLAYTNRFLTIAGLIRGLHKQFADSHDKALYGQIINLRKRINLIKSMQFYGIASLFLCVLCMFLLFSGEELVGRFVFGLSLILLLISLAQSILEIQISVKALNIQLSDLEQLNDSKT
jgi:hypothetical protein